MKNEYRTENRVPFNLELKLGNGVCAVTRNVSESGLFFEINNPNQVGDQIDLEMDLDFPGGLMKFKAKGEILRIEPRGSKTGIALKFLTSWLEPAD